MNTTAALILSFFVCVNVGIFIINSAQVFNGSVTGTDSPTTIMSMLVSVDTSTGALAIGGTALIVTTIIGWAAGNLVFGGALGVGIFTFVLVSPIIRWVLFGIPMLMDAAGITAVAPYLTIGMSTVIAVPIGLFVLSLIAQRPITEH